jgi:hypothetical protein
MIQAPALVQLWALSHQHGLVVDQSAHLCVSRGTPFTYGHMTTVCVSREISGRCWKQLFRTSL